MQKYRLVTAEAEAIQLNHKNWFKVRRFLGFSLVEDSMNFDAKTFSDVCGEAGPFLEIAICNHPEQTEDIDHRVVKHGDWIVKMPGGFLSFQPEVFKTLYVPVG